MKRPICVCCGKPYGQRHLTTETVRWPIGQPAPPYRGNGIVVKESKPYRTIDRATVRGLTMLSVNPSHRAMQEADLAKIPETGSMTMMREIWDGESLHGGYKPFCTLRCALAYARAAYASRRAVMEPSGQ